jgi:hypothetical protein
MKNFEPHDSNDVRLKKQSTIIAKAFIVLLMVQIVLLSYMQGLAKEADSASAQFANYNTAAQTAFIDNTIRAQERKMLSSMRESWVSYLALNPDTRLLTKDGQGFHVYESQDKQALSLNPATMRAEKQSNKKYNIYSKQDGILLLENATLQWNDEEVKDILNIVAAPAKAFGQSSSVIVFDSSTGEIIFDTQNGKTVLGVAASDGKRYITLDDQLSMDSTTTQQYMQKSDSDVNTRMVSTLNEHVAMCDPNDFGEYPLGDYHREFQEKVILPYQTVGTDGQDMQLTIVLGAQEQEIMSEYKNIIAQYDSMTTNATTTYKRIIVIPMVSMTMCLLIIVFAIFNSQASAYLCRKQINKNNI